MRVACRPLHSRVAPARLLAALVVALLATACGARDGHDTTAPLSGAVREPALHVGDVSFNAFRTGAGLDPPVPAGRPFHTRAAPGELLVVYFGYTFCPDVCPTTLADLAVAFDALGPAASEVTLAMVTVDPERDDLDVLSAYLGHFSDRFVAIRPDDEDELRAAESAYLASSSVTRAPSGDIEVAHTAAVYLVDDAGDVRVEWPFGTDARAIAYDLRAVLQTI